MQKGLAVFTAIWMSTAVLTGCGSNENDQTAKPSAPSAEAERKADPATPSQPTVTDSTPSVDDSWTLKLTSNCEQDGVAAENCVAYYGFTVQSNGVYKVGPGPQGQMREGKITDAELAELNTKLTVALTDEPPAPVTSPATVPTEQNPDSRLDSTQNDTDSSLGVIYTFHNESKIFVKTPKNTGSFSLASSEEDQGIQAAMQSLAGEYYPATFPSLCLEAVDAITAKYNSIQSCTTDADCTYLVNEQDRTVFRPNSLNQWFSTSSGRMIPALTVANSSSFDAAQNELNTLLGNADQVCTYYDDLTVKSQENGFVGRFDLAPVCEQNVCKVNPAALALQ